MTTTPVKRVFTFDLANGALPAEVVTFINGLITAIANTKATAGDISTAVTTALTTAAADAQTKANAARDAATATAAADATTKANAARDAAKAASLPLAGGTLTGPLLLAGAPANVLGAATKAYVDGVVSQAKADLIGGSPAELDAFNEAFQRFLTDEAAVTALTAIVNGKQPSDATLTALSGLATTTFGRGLLNVADASALRTVLGLGTAATKGTGTSSGTVAAGDDTRIVQALPVLPVLATVTAAGALTIGKTQPVDATSGPITMTALPALSAAAVGDTYGFRKTDSSGNIVTVPFAAGDTTMGGLAYAEARMAGDLTLQAVAASTGGGKFWRVVNHVRGDAALDGRYLFKRAPRPLLPAPSIVGGTTNVTAKTGAFATGGATFRIPYKTAYACTSLQMLFATWRYESSTRSESTLTNTLPIKVSIEYNGAYWPVFFNGQRNPTIADGAQILTDPLGVVLPAGAEFYVRTWADGAKVPQGGIGGGPGITATGSWVNGSDAVDAVGALTTAPIAYGAFAPIWVGGAPLGTDPKTLICIGDSIPTGYYDTHDADYSQTPYSWFTRWVNAAAGAQRLCGFDDRASVWATAGGAARRLPIAASFSNALITLGTNDLNSGRTLAQLQTDYTTLVQNLQGLGCKVMGATLLPRNGSSDQYATTANQTKPTWEASRIGFNDWLRSKPLGLVGIVDAADTVETARNSGLWVVNGTAQYLTGDGTHPNPVGHARIAAGLPDINTVLAAT